MEIKYLIILISVFSTCLGIRQHHLDNAVKNTHFWDLTQIPEYLKHILVTNFLIDNNIERILSFKDVIARERKVITLRNSVKIWQVSNGFSLIQLVYSNSNELLNCNYVYREDLAKEFMMELYREIAIVKKGDITSMKAVLNINTQNYKTLFENNKTFDDYYQTGDIPLNEISEINNSTYIKLKDITDIPNDMKPLLNFTSLKLECHRKTQLLHKFSTDSNHQSKKQRSNSTEYLKRNKRSLSDLLIAPNTKWCGRGHKADNYNELGGAAHADKCCRKHDHCKSNIQGMSTKWNLFNFRMYTISHCNCDIRYRRDLSSFLRIPGTKWCGKGWDAKRYSDLGGYSKVDRCCRQHDKSCIFWIMGFQTKYNFYNWRVNTLMHCKCDERFRTCLKMAETADANLVGKLFFNIVQTKCFVIKWEKVCKKRAENGKCEKMSLRKRAHLRENRKF